MNMMEMKWDKAKQAIRETHHMHLDNIWAWKQNENSDTMLESKFIFVTLCSIIESMENLN